MEVMETSTSASMVFPVHRLTPYLRVRITTDERSLSIDHRRALAGLIPLGIARIRIPLIELGTVEVRPHVRWSCLLAALLFAAVIVMVDLPVIAAIGLGILAALEVALAFGPGRAIHVTSTDGRSWIVPFCRAHAFDASLALEDALQRRELLLEAKGEDADAMSSVELISPVTDLTQVERRSGLPRPFVHAG